VIAWCCWRVRSPPVGAAPGAVAGLCVVDPGLAVDRVDGDMPGLPRIRDPPRSLRWCGCCCWLW